MNPSFLEVTFCDGKPLAAYFHLPRTSGEKSVRSKEAEAGLVIDFARDGQPIGVEITAPSVFTLAALNRVLVSLNVPPAAPSDVAPLVAS